MSRGMIGKIHQDYYPIEETNLWHTIYFNKTAILSGFTFRAVYNIYDVKKVQIESRTCQACLINYAEMQPFLCKITHFLSYKHQNHQKIIQYSDDQQLYTPFRTISLPFKLEDAATFRYFRSLYTHYIIYRHIGDIILCIYFAFVVKH